ncbi:MAG: hypothetical protein ACK53L_25660, partial [Pirellulaceae bacterium]
VQAILRQGNDGISSFPGQMRDMPVSRKWAVISRLGQLANDSHVIDDSMRARHQALSQAGLMEVQAFSGIGEP